VFGLDIGGSGTKGAPVNVESGELLRERVRVPTPEAATPNQVVAAAIEVISRSEWNGPVGCGPRRGQGGSHPYGGQRRQPVYRL
jgi:polyphosphate glucokinase